MKTLIAILFVALCLAAHGDEFHDLSVELYGNGIYTTSQHSKAQNRLKSFEKDFQSGDKRVLAERMNYALRGLFKIAVTNLKRKGFYDTAYEVEGGWREMDGELQRLAVSARDITDFEPWSVKLSVLYLLLETKLGFQLCHTLRLTDIATFLWTPPVIFHPCKYGKTEFDYHFTADNPSSSHPYRGGFPTTLFWLSQITCGAATFSMGVVMPICGPVSYLIELGARNYLSPKLATFIYEKACD